jgi:capsular exopolysaccharide synthesis family protein
VPTPLAPWSWPSRAPRVRLTRRPGDTLTAMDVARHLGIIWRRKWQVLAISVLIASAVFLVSVAQADVYRGEAVISLTPAREESGGPPDEETTLFLAKSYAQRAETLPVMEDVVRRSGLPITPSEAQRRILLDADEDAGFITVLADGPRADQARALAQAAADALLAAVRSDQQAAIDRDLEAINREIASLEEQLASVGAADPGSRVLEARYESLLASASERRLRPGDRLEIVAPARAGQDPVSPKPARNALLAFMAALAINAELFVLLEAFSDRFSATDLSEDLLRLTGLPILARIPEGDEGAVNEGFNTLRTNLLFMEMSERLYSVAFVSVEPGAGKSFSSIHLARAMTSIDISTVLVDGDIRRPVLHERLGVPRAPGFSNVLNGHQLADAVREVPGEPMLRLLPAGGPVADPAGLFALRPLRKVLRALQAEMVVVDTPAESLFADAVTIASQCDLAVLVVDLKATHRKAVRAGVERLRQLNVNLVGALVNRAELPAKRSYYTRYQETEPARASVS